MFCALLRRYRSIVTRYRRIHLRFQLLILSSQFPPPTDTVELPRNNRNHPLPPPITPAPPKSFHHCPVMRYYQVFDLRTFKVVPIAVSVPNKCFRKRPRYQSESGINLAAIHSPDCKRPESLCRCVLTVFWSCDVAGEGFTISECSPSIENRVRRCKEG